MARASLAALVAARLAAPEAEGLVRPTPPPPKVEVGLASWYGPGFAGRPTASGEPFDPSALTCAHPSAPFGSRVLIETEAGRSLVLRVNDRGPFVPGSERIVDVSEAAAARLGFRAAGLAWVRLTFLEPPK